jgi:hypothetical protein
MAFGRASAVAPKIDIGSRRELFVDRHLIETLGDITLDLHHPVKTKRPESPLPVRHMMPVIKDGDLFRAYYRGSNPDCIGETYTGHPGETVFDAESLDTGEWTFPDFRIVAIGGTTDNNAILTDQLLTKPVTFRGDELTLKFSTGAAGTLRVELPSDDGRPLPGFTLSQCVPIDGDAIDTTVCWRGDRSLSDLQQQSVRLRIVIQKCELYSFQFRSRESALP